MKSANTTSYNDNSDDLSFDMNRRFPSISSSRTRDISTALQQAKGSISDCNNVLFEAELQL